MKFSIITVVLNAKESFEKTVNSIKKQSFKDFEFVVVDGNSSDGTLEVIERNKDFINQLIIEKDDGLYYAMNKGKNIAEGEFLLFMNSGDVFLNDDVLKEVAERINENDKLYYGNTVVYYDKTYKKAPEKHHQSIFFPLTFCKKNDYNADKYKVTAEGDFIHRALKDYPSEFIDVDIILSKLEGFRVTRFKTISGLKLMYNEVVESIKEEKGSVSLYSKMDYLFKSFVKYFGFQFGGMQLVAKILLRSYPNSTRDYKHLDL